MKTIIGLFERQQDVESVLAELRQLGLGGDALSVVMHDPRDHERELGSDGKDALEAQAMTYGGAAVGGVLGMIAGFGALGALAIPGIGPIIAVGTLGAALASTAVGAGVGAAAGGLIGALTNEGVSEEDARAYAEGVRRGGSLITAHTDDSQASQAEEIMRRHGAADVTRRRAEWEEQGWSSREVIAERPPLAGEFDAPADRTGLNEVTTDDRLRVKAEHQGAGGYDSAGRLTADPTRFDDGEPRVSDAERHELNRLSDAIRESGARGSRKMDIEDPRYGTDGTPYVDPVERAAFERERIAAPDPDLVAGAVTGAALGAALGPLGAAAGASGATTTREQDAGALGGTNVRDEDALPADPERNRANTPAE
jgi:hypothetical protein